MLRFGASCSVQKYLPAIGIPLLLGTVLIVLLTGSGNFSAAVVEDRLKEFGGFMAQEAERYGKSGSFTHGAIAVDGWGFDKKAMVNGGVYELSGSHGSLRVSVDKIAVMPDQASADKVIFDFPSPLAVSENGRELFQVQFDAPLRYVLFRGMQDRMLSTFHVFQVPSKLAFVPAAGGEPTTMVAFDALPLARAVVHQAGKGRETAYDFRNVTVIRGEKQVVTLGGVSSTLVESPQEKGGYKGNYAFLLNDLQLERMAEPVSVALDFDFVGERPSFGLGHIGNTVYTVNKLSVMTDAFKLSVKGNMATSAGDRLPSGSLEVTMENARSFLQSDLMPAAMREGVRKILLRIVGRPEIEDKLVFALRREAGGTLYVGNASFEELVAGALADVWMGAPAVPTASFESGSSPEAVAPDEAGESVAGAPQETSGSKVGPEPEDTPKP